MGIKRTMFIVLIIAMIGLTLYSATSNTYFVHQYDKFGYDDLNIKILREPLLCPYNLTNTNDSEYLRGLTPQQVANLFDASGYIPYQNSTEKAFLNKGLQVEGNLEIFNTTHLLSDEQNISFKIGFPNSDWNSPSSLDYAELMYVSGSNYLSISSNVAIQKRLIMETALDFSEGGGVQPFTLAPSGNDTIFRRGNLGQFKATLNLFNSDLKAGYSSGYGLGGNIRAERYLITDYRLGVGLLTPNYPLEVATNVNNISIYAQREISATGYNTRTSVFDTSLSNSALDFIKDANDYKGKDGKIDHSKFYGYKGEIEVTDYNRPVYVYETVVELDSRGREIEVVKEFVTYPHTTLQAQISITDEIDVLRQAIHELKLEIDKLKTTQLPGGKE